jgi:hypothetical protein
LGFVSDITLALFHNGIRKSEPFLTELVRFFVFSSITSLYSQQCEWFDTTKYGTTPKGLSGTVAWGFWFDEGG